MEKSALESENLSVGHLVFDEGENQFGKVTDIITRADGSRVAYIQFQNGRRAIVPLAKGQEILAWVGNGVVPQKPDSSREKPGGSAEAGMGDSAASAIGFTKKELEVLAGKRNGIGVRGGKKKVKKAKSYIPMGWDIISDWKMWPDWIKGEGLGAGRQSEVFLH
jgi:hypothetical protein